MVDGDLVKGGLWEGTDPFKQQYADAGGELTTTVSSGPTKPSPKRMVRVPIPYQPMLLSSAPCPSAGDRWVHEPKLDGWRCFAQVQDLKVRLWTRDGQEWSPLLGDMLHSRSRRPGAGRRTRRSQP